MAIVVAIICGWQLTPHTDRGSLIYKALAQTGCVPNPNLHPPFVNGCPITPSSLNTMLSYVGFGPNILYFGGAGDGVTDNTSAINAALAAAGYLSSALTFPPGLFVINSHISYTMFSGGSAIRLAGSGQEATQLIWPTSSCGMEFDYIGLSNSVYIDDLSFLTGQAGAGCDALFIKTNLANITVPVAAFSVVERVTFRGSDGITIADYWTRAIHTFGVGSLNCNSCIVFGAVTGNVSGYGGNGFGIDVEGDANHLVTIINVNESNFQAVQRGVINGNNVQGLTVNATNFTGGQYGVYVSTGLVGPYQIAMTNSQCNVSVSCLFEGTNVPGSQITNNLVFVPLSSSIGFDLEAAAFTQLTGNQIGALVTHQGIGIKCHVTSAGINTISGNIIESLATGIELDSGCLNEWLSGNGYYANAADVTNAVVTQNVVDKTQSCMPGMGLRINNSATGITYVGGFPTCEFQYDGQKVFLWGSVFLSSKGVGTGSATIAGMPFAAGPMYGLCEVSPNYSGMASATGFEGYILPGTTVINLAVPGAAQGVALADTNLSNSSQFYFACNYATQ